MGLATSIDMGPSERDNGFCFVGLIARYLLRDGSKVSNTSDPSGSDVFSYQKPTEQELYPALSIKAERSILKSVNLEPLVEQSNVPAMHNRAVAV